MVVKKMTKESQTNEKRDEPRQCRKLQGIINCCPVLTFLALVSFAKLALSDSSHLVVSR